VPHNQQRAPCRSNLSGVLLFASVVAVRSLTACGSTQATGSPDAGTSSTGTSSNTVGTSGSGNVIVDAAPEQDSSDSSADVIQDAVVDDAGLLCPGNISALPYIQGVVVMSTPPTLTASPIPDGTYVLSGYTLDTIGSCGSTTTPDSKRAVFVVNGSVARLDIQTQGEVEQCAVGTFASGVFAGRPAPDAGYNLFAAYEPSTDAQSVSLIIGSSGCSIGDGASSTTTPVYTLVRQ
jgi:hypothetical protein